MKSTALLLLLTLFGLTVPGMAQQLPPVAFVTITGGNANYPNGTITATFTPPPNTAQSSYSGQRFPIFQSAVLSPSGAWNFVVADNSTLFPAKSQWQIQLCSQGTYLVAPTCYLVTMPITCIANTNCVASTLNLTSTFSAAPVPPGGGNANVTLPAIQAVFTNLQTFTPCSAGFMGGDGTCAIVSPLLGIGTDSAGHAISLPEKGFSNTGMTTWDDDFNGGTYDPRDARWAGGIYGSTPAAAAQAMSNQMACDLAMGVVKHARAKWPQGNFPVDQLLIAPGSTWEGVATAQGGTFLYTNVNNHFAAKAPNTMTVTCSDGNSHTDSLQQARVAHFTFGGCAVGGCSNASGDHGSYAEGGPGNTGLQMSGFGNVAEFVYAQNFGGFGIRIDGQDSKAFHNTLYNDLMWYYYGGYKGIGESATSPEANAVTTGATSSVALSWTAVTGATGYVVYRGSTAGGESAWFSTNTNSFTDTGAAGVSGTVTNVVTQTTAAAPGTVTTTPSGTGGTLAAGTYYYKVTSSTADIWHGSIEFNGLDVMSDWIEAYGLFDAPTIYTYHHLTDILLGGGDSHFDHLWPQLGLVGISQPFGVGAGDMIENFRVDFARLEGIFIQDQGFGIRNGLIDGSCTAANAATINTGQVLPQYAGTCNQLLVTGLAPNVANVQFADNNGFGPTQKTADILISDAVTGTASNVTGSYQYIPGDGVLSGIKFTPATIALTNVTGPTPNVQGLWQINPADTTPTNYTNFTHVQNNQDLYIAGGNSNVTIKYNPPFTYTCSGSDLNLGTIPANTFVHFLGHSGNSVIVHQVCGGGGTASAATIASSETVTFSATPTFSVATRSSIITMTGNITSFTMAAGADGQEKTLIFCQNATGTWTAAAPANVHGFFVAGTTASKCNAQHFTYSAGQTAWVADSPGVINE